MQKRMAHVKKILLIIIKILIVRVMNNIQIYNYLNEKYQIMKKKTILIRLMRQNTFYNNRFKDNTLKYRKEIRKLKFLNYKIVKK